LLPDTPACNARNEPGRRLDACLISITPVGGSGCSDCLEEPVCRALPELVIHCDYHPGNLKFEDGHVTALFDFDWSKIDLRVFDVGLALFYFFAGWGGDLDGCLRLEPLGIFLQAYQERLRNSQGIGPLSKDEPCYLPAMIRPKPVRPVLSGEGFLQQRLTPRVHQLPAP
jgi:hypothetical protein